MSLITSSWLVSEIRLALLSVFRLSVPVSLSLSLSLRGHIMRHTGKSTKKHDRRGPITRPKLTESPVDHAYCLRSSMHLALPEVPTSIAEARGIIPIIPSIMVPYHFPTCHEIFLDLSEASKTGFRIGPRIFKLCDPFHTRALERRL